MSKFSGEMEKLKKISESFVLSIRYSWYYYTWPPISLLRIKFIHLSHIYPPNTNPASSLPQPPSAGTITETYNNYGNLCWGALACGYHTSSLLYSHFWRSLMPEDEYDALIFHMRNFDTHKVSMYVSSWILAWYTSCSWK